MLLLDEIDVHFGCGQVRSGRGPESTWRWRALCLATCPGWVVKAVSAGPAHRRATTLPPKGCLGEGATLETIQLFSFPQASAARGGAYRQLHGGNYEP